MRATEAALLRVREGKGVRKGPRRQAELLQRLCGFEAALGLEAGSDRPSSRFALEPKESEESEKA